MQRCLVIDRDLFPGLDIAQSQKQNVIVKDLHERVGAARVIYVMSAVSTATPVEAPPVVHLANSQHPAMGSSPRFGI